MDNVIQFQTKEEKKQKTYEEVYAELAKQGESLDVEIIEASEEECRLYQEAYEAEFQMQLDLITDRYKGYCAQFTDKFHENYFSYIIHIDSGLESNVSAYHRRSVPSSHAFASTLQLHKSASRFISDRS